MKVFRERLQHISDQEQKLTDIMLEIKRLRGLVAVAQARARKKAQGVGGKDLRLVADASVGGIV